MSALALNRPRGCHTFEKPPKKKNKGKTNANNQTIKQNPTILCPMNHSECHAKENYG